MVKPENFSLLTDLYELTMMQGYFFHSPRDRGVFDMLYRHQPFNGGYVVMAGLSPLLDVLEDLRFGSGELDFLESKGIFKEEFLEYLSKFRFRGDIYSVKEGTVIFPKEPVVRVHGSIMEAQLVESLVLNFINFQSLIATKASRVTDTAGGSPVMEFGLRRAQGIDGALSASRAAYIGGVAATSNVLAGKLYDIPVAGTMAHSWIMSFETELESFEEYAKIYPRNSVLLIDTFDTLNSGITNAMKVFKKLKGRGESHMAVRIDSGDLEYLSKKVRSILDKNGLEEVKIVASSDLDEWIIKQLRDSGAPIDSWGVGTKLVSGADAAALSGVYKITAAGEEGAEKPRLKISNQSDKITDPGIKNVFRFYNGENIMLADLICLESEMGNIWKKIEKREPVRFNHPSAEYSRFTLKNYSHGELLLRPVMKDGKRAGPAPGLSEIREYRQQQVDSLDRTYRRLLNPHTYKVSISDELKTLKTGMIEKVRGGENEQYPAF
jgi:nicotinate phosphoribosyltransferase